MFPNRILKIYVVWENYFQLQIFCWRHSVYKLLADYRLIDTEVQTEKNFLSGIESTRHANPAGNILQYSIL